MSGFTAQSKQIGERTYSVAPLGFGESRDGLRKLLAMLVPSAAEAMARGASIPAALDGKAAAAVAEMLSGVMSRLDETSLHWFEEAFGKSTTVDIGAGLKLDKEGNRAMAFGRDMLAYCEWFAFAMEVNYRDFFVAALAKLKSVLPAKSEEKTS